MEKMASNVEDINKRLNSYKMARCQGGKIDYYYPSFTVSTCPCSI
jgi:hypothetical protein